MHILSHGNTHTSLLSSCALEFVLLFLNDTLTFNTTCIHALIFEPFKDI